MVCLHSTIKIKFHEESIKTCEKTIERIQLLQDIFIQDNVFSASATNNVNDQLQSMIAKLSERINNLNFAQAQKRNHSPHVRKKWYDRQGFQNPFKTRYNSQPPKRQQNFRKQTERCQLCYCYGHVVKNCFKWQRANAMQKQQHNKYRRDNNRSNADNLNY